MIIGEGHGPVAHPLDPPLLVMADTLSILLEILYNFSYKFVTLLSNTWFRINKSRVFALYGPLCIVPHMYAAKPILEQFVANLD